MRNNKPRILMHYKDLDEHVKRQIQRTFSEDFSDRFVSFVDEEGLRVSALPFETKDHFYLVRMTLGDAREILFGDREEWEQQHNSSQNEH